MKSILTLTLALTFVMTSFANGADKISVLIVDGQNNHRNWPNTTKIMKKSLEDSGLFTVDVARTRPKGADPDFKPKFSKYKVVLSNYNGAMWPEETQKTFIDYVKGGGGLAVVHAADNAFGKWAEYNEMIGLGGWGGRNEKSGPYVYWKKGEGFVRDPSKGRGGGHGPQHPFQITTHDSDHPITKGLPALWMHEKDELYQQLRGPAKNMKVLATAHAAKDKRGTDRNEPMIMVISYGKGRVFHTPMGHGDYSMKCSGYITVLQRGVEWAATGKVTQKVPSDFPSADKPTQRAIDADKLPDPVKPTASKK